MRRRRTPTPRNGIVAHFGWEGLLFEHPDDWAPVVLTGDRRSGYVRLASSRALSLQVRWVPDGRDSLQGALDCYLDRLSRDARRRRCPFSRELRPEEGALRYRYRGETDGDGLLFPTGEGRVAFVEALGESTTARTRLIDRVRTSFSAGRERWSVMGLDVSLPAPLRVEKKEFFAGRTSLILAGGGVRVVAERWGLAESLLARASLAEWTRGRLGRDWKLSPPVESKDGVAGCRRALLGYDEALVAHDRNANRITLLRVQSRDDVWRPRWDWLN